MLGTSRSRGSFKASNRNEQSFSAIYIIDIIRWSLSTKEPEILSRVIRHAANPEGVKEEAKNILKGVDFVGADAVRVLDSDGVEISLSRLRPD